MPHEVYVKDKEDFVRMRSYGRVTKSDFMQAEKQALAVHAQGRLNGLLIDHREVESFLGVMDMFDFGARIPRSDFHRVAMIVNEIDENYRFLETVAVNRGGNLKMFTSEEAALAWVSGSTQSVQQLDKDTNK